MKYPGIGGIGKGVEYVRIGGIGKGVEYVRIGGIGKGVEYVRIGGIWKRSGVCQDWNEGMWVRLKKDKSKFRILL